MSKKWGGHYVVRNRRMHGGTEYEVLHMDVNSFAELDEVETKLWAAGAEAVIREYQGGGTWAIEGRIPVKKAA